MAHSADPATLAAPAAGVAPTDSAPVASTSSAAHLDPALRSRKSGRPWKAPRAQATTRAQRPAESNLRTKSWDARVEQRTREAAAKKLEQELKDEKAAERDRRRSITKERKAKAAEKARLAAAASKVRCHSCCRRLTRQLSAKKRQRLLARQSKAGKKVAH